MAQPHKRPSRPNRRASRRCLVIGSAQIECRVGGYGLGPNVLVSVSDLSETGVSVIIRTPLEVRQEVEILFLGVGSGRTLKRLATVVWARPNGETTSAGLRFQSALPYSVVLRLTKPEQGTGNRE